MSIIKKTGKATAHKAGKAKITAKGSKGKACITITVAKDGKGTAKEGTGATPSGNTDDNPTYPVISNNPKYHYEITVLNDGTYSSYPSRIYTDRERVRNNRRQCALVFVKTNAPFNGTEYMNGNIPLSYAILVDGEYRSSTSEAYVNIPDNVHKDSSGRPIGGDVWIISVTTPGVHTIEIVEDIKCGYDNVVRSSTKTGVTKSIQFYDFEAEEAQWINETVARYTNSGMTDEEKATALWRVLRSALFNQYFYNIELPDGTKDRMDKITYMNYTAFWINGIGDCGEANWYFQELLKKAGVTYKSAGYGSHVYTKVLLDGEWVNCDATGDHHTIPYSDLIFIN